jgi:uncharacterized membrane protein
MAPGTYRATLTTALVPSSPPESLETRIGSRWMLYTGILALIVGVSCFVQQAIDNGWLTPAAQVLIGGALGIALVLAGSHVVRIGYRLISWPAAFALLVATTTLAALLAHVHDTQGLALIAIGGGFATPFLVGLANGAQVPLFAQLDQLYRVTSVAALGVMLLATSFCYYRYRGDVAPA